MEKTDLQNELTILRRNSSKYDLKIQSAKKTNSSELQRQLATSV